ncbi:adenylate/guanylate cyclase domain-containing protein [Methylobacterium sp. E-065]|uniref:adenylate/guanylate cyclase domain-containing protein n=1 Tax=Methylobacterium sp. E-065 TaxID=2836583 RepID=UPI001FB96051|nr:adenylate/guanylate cyclase domain-containing protein [Methylobacterium sp. E-065]MCJ2016903.1 adenylate/guanylate cyclase domain-containing protein [Methylobacterium sp. E-065]
MSQNALVTIPDFERRSRAVLSADVVGYTRLMEAAESETHARFRALRVDVIDPGILTFRGEIIKNTGDGFLAVFTSPDDAVHCAAKLQAAILAYQRDIHQSHKIYLRMGLHWDPVIFDDNDIFGSGVNIAVRLQGAAPPGETVISSRLLDKVQNLQDFKFVDLGELPLKNLTQAVRAFVMPSSEGNNTDPWCPVGIKTTSATPPTVAVLPFVYLSTDLAGSYFAEGFVEDIILSLSNISEILIVSRGSTMAFRGGSVNPDEVSEKLGVRYVLSGSVRRTGSRVRIAVELVDTLDTAVIWAERYDEPIEEIFFLQDEIATKIVDKIAAYVRRTELQRALRKHPQNLNAYDYLLRGLDCLFRLDSSSFIRARAFLERAQAEDHDYSAPYAFLALWHILNIGEGRAAKPNAESAAVMRLASCAIERDPCNALAIAIEGHGRAMFFGEHSISLEYCERAIALSPNNSWAWLFSSSTPGFIGEGIRGVERAERAIRLSPIGLQAFFNYTLLAQNHYLADNFEEAIRWARKALSLNPRFGNAARVLSAGLVATSRMSEAKDIGNYHRQILPQFRVSEYQKRCPFVEPYASQYVDRLIAAGLEN